MAILAKTGTAFYPPYQKSSCFSFPPKKHRSQPLNMTWLIIEDFPQHVSRTKPNMSPKLVNWRFFFHDQDSMALAKSAILDPTLRIVKLSMLPRVLTSKLAILHPTCSFTRSSSRRPCLRARKKGGVDQKDQKNHSSAITPPQLTPSFTLSTALPTAKSDWFWKVWEAQLSEFTWQREHSHNSMCWIDWLSWWHVLIPYMLKNRCDQYILQNQHDCKSSVFQVHSEFSQSVADTSVMPQIEHRQSFEWCTPWETSPSENLDVAPTH